MRAVEQKGLPMTEFSKDQLDKIREILERAGVKPQCPACRHGMMVINRRQIGIPEVEQLRESQVETSPTVGPTGRIATCVLFACNTCGHVRLHSLTALEI
jgi:hypothetical protein